MSTIFGSNLKNARIHKGLTQVELAAALKTTQQRVSEWERGMVEPSLTTLVRILDVLEVPFEILIEGYEYKK